MPVPDKQRRVSSFVEEEELTDIDDKDVSRSPQRAGKCPLEFIL